MTDDPLLSRILRTTRYLLLDFDGPVCDLFTGNSGTVAAALRDVLRAAGHPAPEPGSDDPFDVLRFAARLGPDVSAAVEGHLETEEVKAATGAALTSGVPEMLLAAVTTGRTVVIVSNNSRLAVETCLRHHNLSDRVHLVIGRTGSNPDLLKPSPAPVRSALAQLRSDGSDCTLVGDSPSDLASAHGAGVRAVGYANKPGKEQTLRSAGADAVITSISQLVPPLREGPVRGTS